MDVIEIIVGVLCMAVIIAPLVWIWIDDFRRNRT